jgi:hypothetical protein
MTDTTEALSAAPVDDVRARNKAIVFAALTQAGIHRVTVDYDGSGDSGQIENVEAWDAKNDRIPFPHGVKIQLASEKSEYPFPEQNLEAAVETLAWDYLEIYSGWENNHRAPLENVALRDGGLGLYLLEDAPRRLRRHGGRNHGVVRHGQVHQ